MRRRNLNDPEAPGGMKARRKQLGSRKRQVAGLSLTCAREALGPAPARPARQQPGRRMHADASCSPFEAAARRGALSSGTDGRGRRPSDPRGQPFPSATESGATQAGQRQREGAAAHGGASPACQGAEKLRLDLGIRETGVNGISSKRPQVLARPLEYPTHSMAYSLSRLAPSNSGSSVLIETARRRAATDRSGAPRSRVDAKLDVGGRADAERDTPIREHRDELRVFDRPHAVVDAISPKQFDGVAHALRPAGLARHARCVAGRRRRRAGRCRRSADPVRPAAASLPSIDSATTRGCRSRQQAVHQLDRLIGRLRSQQADAQARPAAGRPARRRTAPRRWRRSFRAKRPCQARQCVGLTMRSA